MVCGLLLSWSIGLVCGLLLSWLIGLAFLVRSWAQEDTLNSSLWSLARWFLGFLISWALGPSVSWPLIYVHCAFTRIGVQICLTFIFWHCMCGRMLCMLRPRDKRTTAHASVVHCRVLHLSCFARCGGGDMCGHALCMFILSSRHTRNCAYACCACMCLASFMLCALLVRRHALDGLEARACA